jgi:glyoxylase-like metal-dependent hydrolase (beta-lactamase superfamily II)
MLVRQLEVGTMRNFVYLVAEKAGSEGLVVDSGWETEPIVGAVRDSKVKVKFAVATHHHFDHTSSLQELAGKLGAKVVAHERSTIGHDISVRDGDVLNLGESKVRIIYSPGHTEDSICLYDGEDLFTGDTLFIGNCGRTDLPGGSSEDLFRSLHEVILRLPPSTVIYPGHDYGDVPFRRLGEEVLSNPTLSARSFAEFSGVP